MPFGKETSTRRLIEQDVKGQVPAVGVGLWAEEEVILLSRILSGGGSAAADATLEDHRGECSSARRQSWWRGKYRWWIDGQKER